MKMKKGGVVLITGASSGMGKSIALRLAKDGYVVYGGARRFELMEKELKPEGVRVLSLDVCDEASMERAVSKIIEEQGRIDALVNNAGYGSYGAVEDVPMSEAKRQFEVNLFGLARLTQLVLPHMRKARFGKIVNISSIGGKVYTPLGAWYHATKHALEGFSDCLRFEVEDFGVDVIVVEPGGIKTQWADLSFDNMKKYSANGAYNALVERIIATRNQMESKGSEPEIIADVVSKALKAKKPKTRYASGYLAKPLLFLRRWLSDRAFDKMFRTSLSLPKVKR